jgi:hypothetical protein
MSTINKIEILEDGIMQVRVNKIAKSGHEGERDAWGYHRMAAEPGADIDGWRTLLNEHFAAMGVKDVSVDEWKKVKDYAALAHTDEVIAAWNAKLAAAQGG